MTVSLRPARGGLALGFAALITVLAALCGTILLRSLETYRSSAFHVWRLQARAAAEGAAALVASRGNVPDAPVSVGESVVVPGTPVMDGAPGSVTTVPLRAEVRSGGRERYSVEYLARFGADSPTTGPWTLLRLEEKR